MPVTPTRHWPEFVDRASPTLAEPLEILDGMARAREIAGTGIEWNEAAVRGVLAH